MKRCLLIGILVATGLMANAQFDWRVMNSHLSAYGQPVATPNVILAGDQGGLIRRSTDNGANWKVVAYNSATITNIAFINADTGFAATIEKDVLLYTKDAGKSWSKVYLKDSASQTLQLHDIKRIVQVNNTTAIFDIYNHPISAPTDDHTLITRDGGATFELVYAPGDIYHVAGDTLLAFGKEEDNFGIAKFTTYKSVDLGATWVIVKTLPTGLTSDFNFHGINLAFVFSSKVFYITANKNLASDKKLYKTTDGGLTFVALTNPSNHKYDWIHFKNEQEAMVFVADANSAYTTVNGGTSWTFSTGGGNIPALYLADGSVISHSRSTSVLSTNYGGSWTQQSDYIIAAIIHGGHYFLQIVNDSVAYAGNGILDVSGQTALLTKTTDGGLTWKKVKTTTGVQHAAQTYHIIDENSFLYTQLGAVGNTRIYRTDDNGLTSTEVFEATYTENFREIVSIDDKHLAAYSTNTNSIIYSLDSGKTWGRVPNGSTAPLGNVRNIEFPEINVWYAINDAAKIFKSADTGKTWVDVTGAAACQDGIYFQDSLTGYAYGCASNAFYKTEDGGQNWANIKNTFHVSLTNSKVTDMAFLNKDTGFVIDGTANIYAAIRTIDGGGSWAWHSGVASQGGVQKIHVKDSLTAAMFGKYSQFIKYTGNVDIGFDTLAYFNTLVGINELTPHQGILKIYPNPAGNVVNIQLPANTVVQAVKMISITGQIVYSGGKQTTSNIQLSVQSMPNGIYLLELQTNEGLFTGRVIVE